jgi:hypothetical protein
VTNDEDRHELLARIDERVKHIENMLDDFVRMHRFRPIELGFYGLAALMLGALLTAIVTKVLPNA